MCATQICGHMELGGGNDLEKSPGAGRELQTLAVGFCPHVGFAMRVLQ